MHKYNVNEQYLNKKYVSVFYCFNLQTINHKI
ncbi:hypothetical protein SAMN06297280_1376 [Arsukibacterium tuosuense]|uniref:Uncharacterized protein n=1 Tax=Arsukibacterium tuosuense TaxID=1323745 RepID=A0A285INA3_9GAMM|nr:hypothetical protein SAMN06297280_1376 [Arsukibacterium tuosuense]